MKKLLLALSALFIVVFSSGCGGKNVKQGELPKGELNTYFIAPLMDVATVEQKLSDAGFIILGKTEVGKAKNTAIIFTCPNLKRLADAPMRGHLAGAMRALVNVEGKEVRISNPKYFIKAFMQNDYKAGSEDHAMMMLNKAFPTLTTSKDMMEEDKLADYKFMVGRPMYNEQIELAKGASVAELSEKLKAKIKPENIIYELTLSENRVVYGVRIGKRTEGFVDKIGNQNSAIIPWQIVIEKTTDGAAAYGLRADYLIAVSYPLLDLMGFASIMSTPDSIKTDLENLF